LIFNVDATGSHLLSRPGRLGARRRVHDHLVPRLKAFKAFGPVSKIKDEARGGSVQMIKV
jgi:hypothetical protein